MTESELHIEFQEQLYNDIDISDEYWNHQPLLAHYTTVETVEKVFRNREVWLSNPLFMNDYEEVRFGVNTGCQIAYEMAGSAFRAEKDRVKLQEALSYEYTSYSTEKALDLYVMCFSEHDRSDRDGRLSMWRGYGQNGRGAAIVFDTSKITPINPNPLAIAKVKYGSGNSREKWLRQRIESVYHWLSQRTVDEQDIAKVARAIFTRILVFAVFTKHSGFAEEREWRLAYFQDRDPRGILSPLFGYHFGHRGIEPKLKLRLEPIPGVLEKGFDIENLVHSIILGPTMASPQTAMSVGRMLDKIGMSELRNSLYSSSIPFRDQF